MKTTAYAKHRYATHELKELVWKLRDVEKSELPAGFTRENIIHSPEDLYRNYRFLFTDQAVEIFVVFILSAKNAVTAIDMVTKGTLSASLVHPREVFRSAIVGAVASIIIAHNHPSGNKEPSSEDVNITRQLVEAGKIMGIPVHDHMIFTNEGYTSFAERGLII